MSTRFYALLGLLIISQQSMAAGTVVGVGLGFIPAGVLTPVVGTATPLGIGGIATITALSLIIGTQLIKRKK